MGFCASYRETLLFQASVIKYRLEPKLQDCFTQLVFDNADHNVCTLDGWNTFHSMGGVCCDTPQTSVKNDPIPRLKKIPKSSSYLEKGIVKLQFFQRNPEKNMRDTFLKKFQVFI